MCYFCHIIYAVVVELLDDEELELLELVLVDVDVVLVARAVTRRVQTAVVPLVAVWT